MTPTLTRWWPTWPRDRRTGRRALRWRLTTTARTITDGTAHWTLIGRRLRDVLAVDRTAREVLAQSGPVGLILDLTMTAYDHRVEVDHYDNPDDVHTGAQP